jgi:UDP-glucuronate 4-epimerase
MRYIEILEECLGAKAERIMQPLQPGDVPETWADVTELGDAIGYRPATPIEVGVRNFVTWFREYYSL